MMLTNALGHILSCKEATHLVSRMQERELGLLSRWALRLHLAACEACTRFERQVRFLREAMHRYRS